MAWSMKTISPKLEFYPTPSRTTLLTCRVSRFSFKIPKNLKSSFSALSFENDSRMKYSRWRWFRFCSSQRDVGSGKIGGVGVWPACEPWAMFVPAANHRLASLTLPIYAPLPLPTHPVSHFLSTLWLSSGGNTLNKRWILREGKEVVSLIPKTW